MGGLTVCPWLPSPALPSAAALLTLPPEMLSSVAVRPAVPAAQTLPEALLPGALVSETVLAEISASQTDAEEFTEPGIEVMADLPHWILIRKRMSRTSVASDCYQPYA